MVVKESIKHYVKLTKEQKEDYCYSCFLYAKIKDCSKCYHNKEVNK